MATMEYPSRHIGVAAALALAACADQSGSNESARQMPSSEARAVENPAAETSSVAGLPGPDLDAVLALTPDCQFGEPLHSIFRRLTIIDPETGESRPGRPIEIPGFAAPLTPTFDRAVIGTDHGEEKPVTAELAVRGSWQGLRVAGIRLYYLEESDVSSREVLFLEPPERVHDLLNRRGFALDVVGQPRPVGPAETIETSISVDAAPGGAMLRCSTG